MTAILNKTRKVDDKGEVQNHFAGRPTPTAPVSR